MGKTLALLLLMVGCSRKVEDIEWVWHSPVVAAHVCLNGSMCTSWGACTCLPLTNTCGPLGFTCAADLVPSCRCNYSPRVWAANDFVGPAHVHGGMIYGGVNWDPSEQF
jgi:hypothetical protein